MGATAPWPPCCMQTRTKLLLHVLLRHNGTSCLARAGCQQAQLEAALPSPSSLAVDLHMEEVFESERGTLCCAVLRCATLRCAVLRCAATPIRLARPCALCSCCLPSHWQPRPPCPARSGAAAGPVPLSALKAKKEGELAGLHLFDKASNLLSLHAVSAEHFDYIVDEL